MASQATVPSPPTSTSTAMTTDSAQFLVPPLPSSATVPPRPYQELLSRVCDGGVAVGIAVVAQLLMAGIQWVLSMNSDNVEFPPSVVAMAAIFGMFCACGCIFPGTESFYRNHLKRPADLLNRHMSIGFTIPFLMICNGSLTDVWVVGPIIGCFVLTGLFNTILSYVLALPLQCLMVRWDSGSWSSSDIEKGSPTAEQQRQNPKLRSSVKSVCDSMETDDFTLGVTPSDLPAAESKVIPTRAVSGLTTVKLWCLANPMLLLTWTLALIVGLPLRVCLALDTPLSTLLLFAFWLTSLAIQSSLKTSPYLAPFFRTLLSGLFNAVLWTSLAMAAYLLLDGHLSSRPLPTMLTTLQTKNPLSSALATSFASPITAGDIALSILNAGLVSWGLKLYEYRLQLLSRAGLTVFTVSSLVALGNVSCGPLLAHTMGVAPQDRALAFAARSVTLALGNPVLDTLAADKSLNAAMVVISGIAYQMGLGFGIGRFLERSLVNIGLPGGREKGGNDPRTVAAGVTVGINAAAMGTAYLYETKSEAAPYSALSMMALGVMTVVFSTIQPLVSWVLGSVSRP
ncbi:hypothetical protein QBC41DRAFT_397958 [Cercophora samala]|uniref:LrgB-like protein n=1 Tax=Cercophora samala TaxID=330535 RepID=A0AA39Z959_9PEZI|nr:hypothetical protein QBC41DRAFT_397958 [Cercophora samala]